jgi:hypothetical protein
MFPLGGSSKLDTMPGGGFRAGLFGSIAWDSGVMVDITIRSWLIEPQMWTIGSSVYHTITRLNDSGRSESRQFGRIKRGKGWESSVITGISIHT